MPNEVDDDVIEQILWDEEEQKMIVAQNPSYEINTIKFQNTAAISNRLIEMPYYLTLLEHKLIKYVASLIQPGDEDFKLYKISARTLQELLEWRYAKDIYQYVKELTIGLNKKIIMLERDGRYVHTTWIIAAVFDRGALYIQLSPLLKPYLLSLNKENPFTKIGVNTIFALNSPHSIRIYELLKQYLLVGKRTFTVEQFKTLLGIEDKYPRYSNLKQKVISPAMEEFESNAAIDISFELNETKENRKVEKIEFIIHKKEVLENVIDLIPLPNLSCLNIDEINEILISEGLTPIFENKKTKAVIKEIQKLSSREFKKLIQNVKRLPGIKDYTALLISNKDSFKTLLKQVPKKDYCDRDYEIYIAPPLFIEVDTEKLPD